MAPGKKEMVDVSFVAVKTLLLSGQIWIPDFQRPYAWTTENVSEFWNDLVDPTRRDPYFVGPVVTYEDESKRLGVVDGQQRLTTLILLIACVRDEAKQLALPKVEARARRILLTQRTALPRLEAHSANAALAALQRGENPADQAMRLRGRGVKRLREAHRVLVDLLRADLEPLNGAQEKELRLKALLNMIEGLRVVWSRLNDPLRAFTFFETLNSKGADLETVDLLKNLLFERRHLGGLDATSISAAWAAFLKRLDGRSVAPRTMLYHWWLSKHGYVTKRAMYAAIRADYVKLDGEGALSSVNELELAAKAYVRVARSQPGDWSNHLQDAHVRLKWIAYYGVAQPRPFLLQLLARYSPELSPGRPAVVRARRLREALNAIELFHLVYNAISGRTSLPEVSKAYATRAMELSQASDADMANAAIKGLVADLARDGLRPSRQVFEATLPSSPRYKNRAGANEVLRRALVIWGKANGVDLSGRTDLTIDHWQPRDEAAPWTNTIGNLVLLPSAVNGDFSDLEPAAKQGMIDSGEVNVAGLDFEGVSGDWNREFAEARARRIGAAIYDALEKALEPSS